MMLELKTGCFCTLWLEEFCKLRCKILTVNCVHWLLFPAYMITHFNVTVYYDQNIGHIFRIFTDIFVTFLKDNKTMSIYIALEGTSIHKVHYFTDKTLVYCSTLAAILPEIRLIEYTMLLGVCSDWICFTTTVQFSSKPIIGLLLYLLHDSDYRRFRLWQPHY